MIFIGRNAIETGLVHEGACYMKTMQSGCYVNFDFNGVTHRLEGSNGDQKPRSRARPMPSRLVGERN